jgi:hypothetical protein
VAQYDELKDRLRALKGDLPPAAPETERPPCPDAAVLRDFAAGLLRPEQEEDVGMHLLSCRECARELIAWDAVEQEDETAVQAQAGRAAARTRAASRAAAVGRWFRETLAPRPALAWGVPAAVAAAIVAAIALWPLLTGPPRLTLDARLQAASGGVRAVEGVYSPREELHLELDLPREAYVYVVAIEESGASVIYPDDTPRKLSGAVSIPGDDSAWTGLDAGRYTLLIGTAGEPIDPAVTEKLTAQLAAGADPAEAAAGIFRGTKVVSFRIAAE